MEERIESEYRTPLVMKCRSCVDGDEIAYSVVDLTQEVIDAAVERQSLVSAVARSANYLCSIRFRDDTPIFYDCYCKELEHFANCEQFEEHGWVMLPQAIRLPDVNRFDVECCWAGHSTHGFSWSASPGPSMGEVWTITPSISDLQQVLGKEVPHFEL